jgi:hypothetical protein
MDLSSIISPDFALHPKMHIGILADDLGAGLDQLLAQVGYALLRLMLASQCYL